MRALFDTATRGAVSYDAGRGRDTADATFLVTKSTADFKESASWERSRRRWRSAKPDADLTWGRELDGAAFISKVEEFGGFGPYRSILEIGPGYGRLLHECLSRGVPFRDYLGVDISPVNVSFLRERFDDARVEFILADVDKLATSRCFDLVVSSLVFKHLYPSFERALTRCSAHLNVGGLVCFDLLEGENRFFEDDGVTYIREYDRVEIRDILGRVGLCLVEFAYVEHAPDHRRLFTIARRD